MSENITHTAIIDDASRLACHADTICPVFKSCFKDYPSIVRLGGITRWGDLFNPYLLKALRDGWDFDNVEQHKAEKLAFVLGWMSHRAADRQMKPVFRQYDPDCKLSPSDCSIYHDVFVYREIYENGAREPYSLSTLEPGMASHPGASMVDAPVMEDLFRVMWQRMLLVMHTFKPDADNIETWLDNVITRHQRVHVDIRRYAAAYCNPDPEKVDRFLVQPNFYDRNEPIIALARNLQHSKPTEISIADALAAPAQSRYALALQRAFRYVQAASDFFTHKTDEEQLSARLDIGKPELES